MSWEWDFSQYKKRPWRQTLRELLEFVLNRMEETQLNQVASSLTLTTVLSLVPLVAVVLVSFAVFPGFAERRAELEELLFSSLLPEVYSQQIISYVHAFTSHAQGLTIFGLAGLGITALLLINTVDSTLNRIFHVRQMRPVMQRALIYWALLTLGPAVMAFSLTLTKSLANFDVGVQGVLPGWGIMFLQLIVQSFMYGALYVYVPNCKVKWSHAILGGLLASLVGIVIKWGFSYYLSTGPLTTIYGSFVLIPVVLIWIYLTWLLVLSGAAVAATIPMLTSGRFSDMHKTGNDFITGIALLHELMVKQEQGQSSVSIHTLCKAVDSYPEAAGAILEQLAEAGYVGKLKDDRKYDEHWSLLVSPQTTTLSGVFDALLVDQTNTLIAREGAPLYDWYCLVTDAEWKNRPMVESLRLVHPVNR